jgi:hypothetical protein
MEVDYGSEPKETVIKVNGNSVALMVLEYILGFQVTNTKDNFGNHLNTAKVHKNLLMEIYI